MTATLYIDGEQHCSCELCRFFGDDHEANPFAPGIMRVALGRCCTQTAEQLGDIAGRKRVTVRYPFGSSETREATCHYEGGLLLADTKAAKAVRP